MEDINMLKRHNLPENYFAASIKAMGHSSGYPDSFALDRAQFLPAFAIIKKTV
jgi:hypothetical protein